MSELRLCKYSNCTTVLDNPKANTCCDAHRKAWGRETRTQLQDNPDKKTITRTDNPDTIGNPDIQPGQIVPNNPDTTTWTGDNPDTRTQPGQPINWADPDKDYSTIARRTQGKVQVPGDPGYRGVCKLVDGAWCVPSRMAVL